MSPGAAAWSRHAPTDGGGQGEVGMPVDLGGGVRAFPLISAKLCAGQRSSASSIFGSAFT